MSSTKAFTTATRAHYFDAQSMRYREEFIYDKLFSGLDLNGKRVADLACGSGYNSVALLARYPEIRVCGFDISSKACEAYPRNTGFPAYRTDLTLPIAVDRPFDVAFVVGGLHQTAKDLPMAVQNLARLLKPGGLALFLEPNRGFYLETVRSLSTGSTGSTSTPAPKTATGVLRTCRIGHQAL